MLVSWNWLKDYVTLDMPPAEVERRLMMAGLNHESSTPVGDDLAIDFEVTSNRPDCLGHLGIAREIAVLFDRQLRLPPASPPESSASARDLAQVRIDCPELCSRYIARVIRGVKVGPSPPWLRDRLAAIGIAAINNVVDVTNYVLMECGQPLHAFDLARLLGRQIVVRRAAAGEQIEAIDHRLYELTADTCVIADARLPVAIGGVMGGAASEVTPSTTELLIESALFDPASIRGTARRLNLHSDSSYRFERSVDPEGVDWASRRACELILEVAGGQLAAGSVDVGRQPDPRQPIILRFDQLRRILGIDIPPPRVRHILAALGLRETRCDAAAVEVVPPSWRGDLAREIDLIEEAARIHGYDAIPEDVSVPMAPSALSAEDRVLARVRHVLTACGFDEALTASAVDQSWSEAFTPWTSQPPLVCQTPVLRRADRLRRSLVPSLLGARRTNESLGNPVIELFEIARAYLPRPGQLPDEIQLVALTSGGDFLHVKGVVEAILAELNCRVPLEVRQWQHPLLDERRACQLWLSGQPFGVLGEAGPAGLAQFDLHARTTIAEFHTAALVCVADLAPRYAELAAFPAISRDINLVVDESVAWADLAATVQDAAGQLLESLAYEDTYRDREKLGPGKKSLLFSIRLRSRQATLTHAEADALREKIVAACAEAHGARLRA